MLNSCQKNLVVSPLIWEGSLDEVKPLISSMVVCASLLLLEASPIKEGSADVHVVISKGGGGG